MFPTGIIVPHTTLTSHIFQLEDGFIQYRWDCGSGVGVVRIRDSRVSDGEWHTVKVSRRGRNTKLGLDDAHVAEGSSPAGSDVINLYRDSTRSVIQRS